MEKSAKPRKKVQSRASPFQALCRCHLSFFLQWHPEGGVMVLTLHKGKLKPREQKHPSEISHANPDLPVPTP